MRACHKRQGGGGLKAESKEINTVINLGLGLSMI